MFNQMNSKARFRFLQSKVRLQTQPRPGPGQVPLYTGTLDCAKKIMAKEVNLIRRESLIEFEILILLFQ